MYAKITVKREIIEADENVMIDDVETVKVNHMVSAGILVSDNNGDNINETLIPWHRIYEVWSTVEGELYLASGR